MVNNFECILVIAHSRSGTNFTIDSINYNFQNAVFHKLRNSFSPGPDTIYLGQDDGLTNELKQYLFRNDTKIPILKSHFLPEEFDFAIGNTIYPSCYKELVGHIYNKSFKIYVYRDCKDVMVSLYHFLRNGGGLYHNAGIRYAQVDFSQFIRMTNDYINPIRRPYEFDSNRVRYWQYHVSRWKKQNDVFFISYEDLAQDWDEVMQRLCDAFSPPMIKKSNLIRPTIEKKKNLMQRIKSKIIKSKKADSQLRSSAVNPRKGVAGEWKNYFSEDDLQFVAQNVE